ncbi:helix-turn-helix transcriptional regulator [Subtercola sp. PAMC28395]|uniref:helix-turn-helix transcriptional regulator n=1 Tax=Subtercola sp. PAMC28395 TaxID=2846775 RepID=UPI001C0B4536|nr:helix-turn-helix transcriptional regulator [Subtercola sp. PAMC28395]QWT22743.1 helix-turn-helix transcriptional regulator [Subtercola sp. PAMC28395]
MNPVFGHGHLRLYLLSLLAEHPRHGYELIQALSDRFGGTYSPSAGTIYPRLAKLEEEGLVTKSADGRKTIYEITVAGRAELAARSDELDSIEDNVTDTVRMLADSVRAGVNTAMRSLRADLASAAREASRTDTRSNAGRSYAGPASGAPAGSAPDAAAGEFSSGVTGSPTGTAGASSPSAPTSDEQRRGNTDALREAETALATFRAKVRADLRKHAAKGAVPPQAVRQLTDELTRIQAELHANLSAR